MQNGSARLILVLVVPVVITIVFLAGLGAVAERSQPEYPVTADVIESRVVGREPTCSWEIDIELRNDSDRPLRLVSVEISGIEDSEQKLVGTLESGEVVLRTYQHSLTGCSAPEADELTAWYGTYLATKDQSVTFSID